MKLFNTLLVGSAALFGHVAANGAAMGYELVQFYYVYKMEYTSKIPAKDRRLAVECTKAKGEMCYFDEFVLSLLADGPLKSYFQANHAAKQHTQTPDDSSASSISNNANNDDTIDASKLSETHPKNGKPVVWAKVVEDLTDVAQKASDAGGVAKADADGAASYATKARKVRADDAYLFVRGVMNNVFRTTERQYFDEDPKTKTFKWLSTFNKISDAEKSGALTSDRAKELKKQVRDANKGILNNTTQNNKNHWAAVKAFATFITKLQTISAGLAAGTSSTPAGGGASCASEFKAGSSAARKLRRELMGQAIASARQALQLSPRVSFADGAVAVDGVAAY